ncbi:MAG: hypothetical protein H6Q20_1949 [Bacteroidetes bacterium]|nr:hypothetical protein [Bacteroidota bacterium]
MRTCLAEPDKSGQAVHLAAADSERCLRQLADKCS